MRHLCNLMLFSHISLLLLIYVQVQCDLAITRNTCVNVCSLNCLDLFLKYKIGQTCLVYVCVFGSYMLCIFLLRDVFESFKCCLDFWLSSLLDYIHICVFPLFEKPVFIKLDNFQTNNYPSRPLGFFFSTDLNASSIHRSFLEFVSITSRQILNPSRKFLSGRQILDS